MTKLHDNYYYPLAESLLEQVGTRPLLPRCFYEVDTMRQAWEAVLGSRQKVVETADKLRKLRIKTVITRRDLKHGSPELVLAVTFGQLDLRHQLQGQLSESQIIQLTPWGVAGQFAESLVGQERLEFYTSIISTKSDAAIQAEILQRFPLARELFSFGWNSPTTYRQLLILPDFLEIMETEQGARFYQATMAAYATLQGMLFARIPEWLIECGYRVAADQLSGLTAQWAEIVKVRGERGLSTISSAAMLQAHFVGALERLRHPQSGGGQVLSEMANMFAMWTENACGLTFASMEYLNHSLIPMLARYSKQLEEHKIALQIASLGSGYRPIEARKVCLPMPKGRALTSHAVHILSPLWRDIDQRHVATNLESGLELVNDRIKGARARRLELANATQKTVLDAERIERLVAEANAMSKEAEVALKALAGILAEVNATINSVEAAWAEYLRNEQMPANFKHDEADLQGKLELSQQEALLLREELNESRRELNRLKGKDLALERVEQHTMQLPIDPVLIRKVMHSPDQLTPVEVLQYVQSISDGLLRVLPSAWRSAEEAKHFDKPKRLLTLLERLVFDYAPALATGKPDSEARNLLGGSYAAKESDTVSNNAQMRGERTFTVDDKAVYFERHLKIGNATSSNRGLRIYFEIMDGKVVLAYCGEHLTTVMTS